jgi:hypothetical protein
MTKTSLGFIIEKFDGAHTWDMLNAHTWDMLNADNSFDQWTFGDDGISAFKKTPKLFKTKELADNYMKKNFKDVKAIFRRREYFSVKY